MDELKEYLELSGELGFIKEGGYLILKSVNGKVFEWRTPDYILDNERVLVE